MSKPHGYWNNFDNIRSELLAFIAECGTVGVIPTRGELKKAGRGDLITAIDRHGGVYAVAERLNLVVTTKQKGHWNDFRNVESAIIAFNEKNGTPGVMPTAEQLRQAGQGAFVQAICKKHEGFKNVAQRMGLKFTLTDKPPNYWDDFYNVKQAIFEFIDLQGVSGVIPTQSELRKAGKSGLGRAISKHGGWQSVAERLGLTYSQKKPGYWDLDKVKHEILDFNEKNANSGFMPTGKQLRQAGRHDIENAIQKNGGQQFIAEKLGLIYKKKRANFWKDINNIKSEIIDLNQENGTFGTLPTRTKLNKAGRSDLAAAIDQHGGFPVVAEKLGLEMVYQKKPHGYWQNFSNLESEILKFIEEYGNHGIMPTHTELQKAGLSGLCDAIKNYGGYETVAELLRLELSYQKWTLKAIRKFVASLIEHLETFTSAELYIIFQQSGLGKIDGKGKSFVKALTTGRFPKEELEKFVNGEASVVDNFLEDKQLTLETLETNSNNNIPDRDTISSDEIDATVEASEEQEDLKLPLVQTREVLASLNHHVVSSADGEAVEFLIASAKAKIWKHTFIDEIAAVAQAETYTGDSYAERVKSEFLDEYHRAKNLPIPLGYNFYAPPNLMQRLAAVQLQDKKRVGNWSGTGAGKTLSAILASRVINAYLTVICCPNSVVDGWEKAIINIFPDSKVAKKTFTPDWMKPNSPVFSVNRDFKGKVNRYLILNYEMFQQPDSANRVRSLLQNEQIDFIVIDEIHYTKQRQVDDMSQRKQLIQALITTANEHNPDLHIIGMSATPVINNLQEGKSLVELVTGVAHDELDIRPTLPNCMRLHQRLVTLGIRWMPQYKMGYEQIEIPVDCGEFLDNIRALGGNGSPLALEKILTLARLPVICQHIQPKTLIYTHYVEGIDRLLRDTLEAEGWKVGFYTGEDKSGLEGFLHGKIDVLIGSSAIGTGVDGLQQVCNRLIINVLPWTHAEFEQLQGRIYRQGQRQDEVTIIIPLTYAMVNNERWSWCDSKMQRLKFKKSIADAAVDGVVPEGHLRSPAQTYQDVIAWLERMETGQVEVIARPKIIIPLPDNPVAVQQRQKRYGDFSTMNHHWNQSRSETTHQRLKENTEEWMQYHTLYREARKDWAVVPYEEMIRWCQQRSGYTIGDFGCGEAKLASAVCDRHTVYSFDHIAINENVINCDIAHVPLDDETLDVAIFSLSLMGSNFTDYLQEAHRTLKLDGTLHIIEATSRFTDIDKFRNDLQASGFEVMEPKQIWKFTHIRAIKSDLKPQMQVELRL